jgi:hypothetical protein
MRPWAAGAAAVPALAGEEEEVGEGEGEEAG